MKDHKNIDEIIKLYKDQNFKDAKKKIENLLVSNKNNTYLLNLRGIVVGLKEITKIVLLVTIKQLY